MTKMPNTHKHPAPGVEEIEKEFDSLFSLCRREYVCETCDEKRNWFRAALTSHHQKSIEAVRYMAWCPQCGDALEQVKTENKYNCFGCDADYELTATPPEKTTSDKPGV